MPPSASAKMPFDEVNRISADSTPPALTSLAAAGANPFRFIYVSGILVERDQQKELPLSGPLAPYFHMRVGYLPVLCNHGVDSHSTRAGLRLTSLPLRQHMHPECKLQS